MNELENPVQQEKLNPLLSVWLHPKKTTRYVLNNKGIGYAIFIICLGYIGSMCTGLIDAQLYPMIPLWGIFLLLIFLSPIIGLLSNAFNALLIWLFGKMFKGTGTYKEIFQSTALICIPFIVLIPFYFIWLFTNPNSLSYATFDGNLIFPVLVIILTIATMIWSCVITIATIAEAHQFSNWKAFFTILIPSIIIFIIVFVIIFVIALIVIGMGSLAGF